jgi:voltage-gated potassium channel
MKIRRRVYEILDVAPRDDKVSKLVDNFLLILIILNIVGLLLETVESIYIMSPEFFYYFDHISLIIFTIEYVLRLWSCTSNEKYRQPLIGRLKYSVKFFTLMDFLAIIPLFLPLFGMDLRFTRIVRLSRLVRIGKMVRYVSTFNTLGRVISRKKKELISSGIVLVFFLTVSSCLMYYAENAAQSEKFSSIPAAMWWSIVTLTTVGYGDTYPITVMGKIVGSVIAVIGIFTFALPTAILGAAFIEETESTKSKRRKVSCPKCGHEFKEERRK